MNMFLGGAVWKRDSLLPHRTQLLVAHAMGWSFVDKRRESAFVRQLGAADDNIQYSARGAAWPKLS